MEAMALSPLARAQIRASKIEVIQQQVARTFGLRVEELNQGSRTRTVTMPRQMAMYLAKQVTDGSLAEIGTHFGGKHHTTVMHSIAKIDHDRRTNPAVDLAISMPLKTLNLEPPCHEFRGKTFSA
jgi:chromosomal replication initiator protein